MHDRLKLRLDEAEIIERRDALIDQLEKRIQQHTKTDKLFTLRWKVA